MCHNKELKDKLQYLTHSAYSFFNDELKVFNMKSRFDVSSNNPFYPLNSNEMSIQERIEDIKTRIIEVPGYDICVELMKNDKKISLLRGKLVGTPSYIMLFQGIKACIEFFLIQIFHESVTFDQVIFDKFYYDLEDLFYADYLELVDSIKLYNFSSDSNEIVINKRIKIIKLDINSNQMTDFNENIVSRYLEVSDSIFLIKRIYKNKKRIDDNFNNSKKEIEKDFELYVESCDLFDRVLTAFRILKSSAVYIDDRISTKYKTLLPYSSSISRKKHTENIPIGGKCNMTINEIDQFKNIFAYIEKEADIRFQIAVRRFNSGMERRNPEDQIIDFMIGFETLYLPDENAELSYRICLRAAGLLFSGDERYDNFTFLRKMYKARSDIVHGKKASYTQEDINRLEEFLRKSIKMWIQDKNLFSTDKNGNMDSWLFTPIN